MKKQILVAVLGLLLAVAAWFAVRATAQESLQIAGPAATPAATGPAVDGRHYSYVVGLDIGNAFRKDQVAIDVDSVLAGLKDGLSGAKPRYNEQTCAAAMKRLNEVRNAGLEAKNRDFLAKNAKVQGVQTTASGLQYKIIANGKGATPGPADVVKVHYRGKLIDGTVFDQSYGGDPVSLPVGRVIPGWTEALQLMRVGDKWELTIPSNLAYGPAGAGETIPPHATLVFQIELLGIEPKK